MEVTTLNIKKENHNQIPVDIMIGLTMLNLSSLRSKIWGSHSKEVPIPNMESQIHKTPNGEMIIPKSTKMIPFSDENENFDDPDTKLDEEWYQKLLEEDDLEE
jgi:hypothetical protein